MKATPKLRTVAVGRQINILVFILLDFCWHLKQLRCTFACVGLLSVCVEMKRWNLAFVSCPWPSFELAFPRCLVFIVAAIIIRSERFLALIYIYTSLFSVYRKPRPKQQCVNILKFYILILCIYTFCFRATRLLYRAIWWLTVSNAYQACKRRLLYLNWVKLVVSLDSFTS